MAFYSNFRVNISTPIATTVTVGIASDKTEINAGGVQVVRSDTRYVRMERSGTSSTMLKVGGDIAATGNITAYAASDERLKENIETIESALDKLDKINGVYFDWKDSYITEKGGDDGYFIRKHDVGVIAQEVEGVLKEVVATREDGYKAVRYEKIVPLLIQAIKELREEVKKLSG